MLSEWMLNEWWISRWTQFSANYKWCICRLIMALLSVDVEWLTNEMRMMSEEKCWSTQQTAEDKAMRQRRSPLHMHSQINLTPSCRWMLNKWGITRWYHGRCIQSMALLVNFERMMNVNVERMMNSQVVHPIFDWRLSAASIQRASAGVSHSL